MLRQGFWDAVSLLSQDRPVGYRPEVQAGDATSAGRGAEHGMLQSSGFGGYLMSSLAGDSHD
jgi:hypothetical protein